MQKGELIIAKLRGQSTAGAAYGFRCFEAVKAGKYSLSIQASEGHYCTPRITCSPELYHSMEMAIFTRNGWLSPSRSSVIKAFPRWEELRSYMESSKNPVFGYVPVGLIDDLYLYLINR